MPELELAETEAVRLNQAIQQVYRHYPLSVSQKQLDTVMLAYVMFDVYGTRIATIYLNRNSSRAAGDAQVVPFPGAAG
jgi:hypothetical protein